MALSSSSNLALEIDFKSLDTKQLEQVKKTLDSIKNIEKDITAQLHQQKELLKKSELGNDTKEIKNRIKLLKDEKRSNDELHTSIRRKIQDELDYQKIKAKTISMAQKADASGMPKNKAYTANDFDKQQIEYAKNIIAERKKLADQQEEAHRMNKIFDNERMAMMQSEANYMNQQYDKNAKRQARAIADNQKINAQRLKDSQVLTNAWGKFEMVFGRVVSALASFMIINTTFQAIGGFFRSLISSNQLLEVFNARLEKLVGNSAELKNIYASLQKFTVTTPFKIQDVMEASISLKAFGQDIVKTLPVIGDWASAIGKDLNDVALAYAKIVNYSPRTSLLLSTRGLSQTMLDMYVAKFGTRVEAMNQLINDLYGGTAQRISDTFEGILSNLNDIWIFISQKMGASLFRDLKSDLKYIYDILNRINNGEGGGLQLIGNSVATIVKGLGGLAVAGGVAFLAMKMAEFYKWLKLSSEMAFIFGKTAIFTVIASQLGSVIWNQMKYNNLLKEEESIREKLRTATGVGRTGLNTELQGILQEKIAQFEKKMDVSKEVAYATDKRYRKLVDELELQNRITDKEKEQTAERQRQLMLQMSQVDAMRDYEVSQQIQTENLQDFTKQLAKNFANRATMESTVIKLTGGTPGSANRLAGYSAMSTYLEGLSGGITKKEAISKLQNDLLRWSKQSTITNLQELTAQINEFIEALKSLSQLKENKMKDYGQAEIISPNYDFDAYSQSIVKTISYEEKLAEIQSRINDKTLALNSKASAFGEIDINIKTEINNLIAEKNKLIDEEDKKWSDLYKKQEDFRIEKIKYNNTRNGTDTEAMQNEIDLLNQIGSRLGSNLEDLNTQLEIQKQIFILQKELDKNSLTFADAFQHKSVAVKNELLGWRDTLAELSWNAVKDFGTSGLTELIYGTKAEEIDTQLIELRDKYMQVRKEKAGIKIIEDQEVSILAQINKLEQERANIIRTLLDDIGKRMMDKGIDMLIDYGLTEIMPNSPIKINNTNTGVNTKPSIRNNTGNSVTYVTVTGDILDGNDFARKVRKANIILKENKV